METDEQGWNRPAAEREALITQARDWPGTQREFAALHGVSQGTVSKWQKAASWRKYSDEERAAALEGFASFDGPQRAYDDALGLPRGTVGKWVQLAGRSAAVGRRAPPSRMEAPRQAPTFIEVVPATPAQARLAPSDGGTGVRLTLPGGAELSFEALPPASWVAELAAELRRG